MTTHRLNQLKTKEKDLLEESVISKELIDNVLLKIRNSIKNLDHEENRLKFNKKILTIVLLADKFNQILMQFNLMLEELIISEDYKAEKDSVLTANSFDQELKDRDNRKDELDIEKTENSLKDDTEFYYVKKQKIKNEKKIVLRKSDTQEINRLERKLSCDEEFKICRNPATFASESFGEDTRNIPEKISAEKNNKQNFENSFSNVEICQNPASFAPEILLPEETITDNTTEIKQEVDDDLQKKFNDNYNKLRFKGNARRNNTDYKPTINSIRKHEIETDLNDQEIAHRKVLEYLQKQPERPISPRSKQKIAIDLGAPELIESKFQTSKKFQELQKSKFYPDIVSYSKSEITNLNNKKLKATVESCEEENIEYDNLAKDVVDVDSNKNGKDNVIFTKEYSRASQNSVTKCNQESSNEIENNKIDKTIAVESEISDAVIEKLSDADKVTVQNDDRCIVTHINSPGCFYIITATESIIDYDRFHELLQQHCESDKSRKFSSKKEMMTLGANYFCCYNEVEDYNCTWFRCIITDWLMNNSEKTDVVKVFAVDDGFEKEISLNQLRDFPDNITKMPRMAIKCCLRDIYPPHSSKDNIITKWPEECIQFFHDIVQHSRENPFTVTNIRKNGDFYEVNLRNERRLSVSKAMMHMGFGVLVERDELFKKNEDNIIVKSDFMRQQILKAQGFHSNDSDWENMEDIEENLNQAVANAVEGGYTPQDARRLCKFTKVDGQPCFKGERCRFEHRLPNPDGWTTDKEIAYTETINKLEMPAIGARIKLVVTSVRSVCRFFAHFKLSPEEKRALISSNIVSTATQFSKYVNKPEHLKTLRKLRTLPALGQLVLARSSADDRWYRARVIMINAEDEFEVLFIDYGDRSIVPFNNLREIRKEHLGMPEQAVDCRIANVDPLDIINKAKSTEAAETLSKMIIDKTVTAIVTDNGYPLEVLLYTENGMDIGEHLKQLKVATERSSRFIMKTKEKRVEC